MEKRPALGKGLSALIPDTPLGPPQPGPVSHELELEVDRLTPNDYQPRLNIDDGRLEQLAASIRANGVIQPIVVRKVGDGYRISAGERRWRAARLAGLTRVPVVVKEVPGDSTDQRVLQMALVENIQRDDLNPIDEAKAYRRLADEFSLTQDAIASAVGIRCSDWKGRSVPRSKMLPRSTWKPSARCPANTRRPPAMLCTDCPASRG